VLDSVLQTFKDTPVEDKIVAFKDAILKNYKLSPYSLGLSEQISYELLQQLKSFLTTPIEKLP
jgi:hypothetical protein